MRRNIAITCIYLRSKFHENKTHTKHSIGNTKQSKVLILFKPEDYKQHNIKTKFRFLYCVARKLTVCCQAYFKLVYSI